VDRSLAFRAWLGRLVVSRAPHALGLVSLAPIACWLALPALIYPSRGVTGSRQPSMGWLSASGR
jgi:hypothetical protein